MDSREKASVMALILTGTSKERAAARWGQDPDFDRVWDGISADIERQRQENPNIQFDIPNEMPDLEGLSGPGDSGSPAAPEGSPEEEDAESPAKEAVEKAAGQQDAPAPVAKKAPAKPAAAPVEDGPAVANLKKKTDPAKAGKPFA